ncbi:MAG: A/G-specific adenine glycosylase [Flavobacteriales bacterium]|nr:A/G-specific adenine glycosylase [Flavobacteriales bacterium]
MTDTQLELINWYNCNKRDLPWRNTKNPYFVWLSEIILQQTRVDQGLPYYARFVSVFPTVFDLASASETEVLKNWQGLGYYSRARNLHFTSKKIVQEYEGVFPTTYDEILKLKGVGSYTAAAIASFCFNEPVAVLDGNVYRVLSRLYDVDLEINISKNKRKFEIIANDFLDKNNPALFNQAIMEFGALQCKPISPSCDSCPLRMNCYSLANNTVQNRPLKLKKLKIRERFIVYWVIENDKKILMRQRKEEDIWKNMFEFPSIEFKSKEEKDIYLNDNRKYAQKSLKHVLSHQHIFATFIETFNGKNDLFSDAKWIGLDDLLDIPLHRLITKFLETRS